MADAASDTLDRRPAGLTGRLKTFIEAEATQRFVIAVIVLNAIVLGLETSPAANDAAGDLLILLDHIAVTIFVVEISIKLIVYRFRFFTNAWNVFDFLIVVVCFIPFGASFAPVLRLFRLFRVLRLVSVIPRLQVIVSALLRCLPSMFYVTILLFLVFYIYAVAGTMFFGANDPVHFGGLWTSMLSLFRVATLEDWTDIMYINMYGSANYGYDDATYAALANIGIEKSSIISKESPVVASVFFVSFIVTGAMIVLNLFIGVVLSGMEEAKKDQVLDDAVKRRDSSDIDIKEEILMMENQLKEMSDKLSQNLLILSKRVKENSDNINKITDDG